MQQADVLALAGLRIDGRRFDEIRTLRHNFGFDKSGSSDASVYFEAGLNKVCVLVQGPREAGRRADAADADVGKITCSIHQLSSLSSSGAAAGGTGAGSDGRRRRGRGGGDRKTSEMEAVVEAAFSSVVLLDLYPRSDVAVTVHVLEADGSLVCAVINAVSLALVQAGVQMRDLLVACAAGVVNKAVCCDLTAVEEGAAGGSGGCYLPMAVKASTQEVVYMQLDARLSLERLQDVTDRGLQGCDSVRRYVEEALREQIAGALERAER